jgi:hypothetical protein
MVFIEVFPDIQLCRVVQLDQLLIREPVPADGQNGTMPAAAHGAE